MRMKILLARFHSELFPGPVTDDDRGRDSVIDERYRGDLGENVVAFIPGPMTGNDRGRDPVTAERYRGDLDENVVVLPHSRGALRFCLADVNHSPSLNAEGGLTQYPDVGLGELQPERLVHVTLVVLDGAEAPVR